VHSIATAVGLYIHAKTTVADAGSMIKTSTGEHQFLARLHGLNRELGIVTNDSAIVKMSMLLSQGTTPLHAATDCSNYD